MANLDILDIVYVKHCKQKDLDCRCIS